MLFEILASNQIQCTLSREELNDRGIDISTCTYRDPAIIKLLEDLKSEAGKSIDPAIKTLPPITEVVPASSELIVILTWSEGNIDLFNPEYSTFTPSAGKQRVIPGDSKGLPVMLPIDELQAGVMADIMTGMSTGTLADRLKKYLNEDFLHQLLAAFSESGLENIIASVYDEESGNVIRADSPATSPKTSKESVSVRKSTPKNPGKNPGGICLSLSFSSLDDVETTLNQAGLKEFAGRSTLFKTNENGYVLVLGSEGLTSEAFDEIKKRLSLLHETREESASFLTHMLEHNRPVIDPDAVKHLTR